MPVEPSVLSNYVKLMPGVRKRLVLTDPVIEEVIRRLRWTVLEEDSVPTTKYFTTPSEKLAQMLLAIWDKRTGDRICVHITEFGTELAKDFEVSPC
jgi:hypothetical protein